MGEAKDRIEAAFGLGELSSGAYSGAWAATAGRDVLECRTPIDGRLLGRVALAGEDDYQQVVGASVQAFREWHRIPAPERGALMAAVGAELAAKKADLGLLVSLEAGKTITEGQGEIQEAVDVARLAAGLGRQLYGLTIASERPDHSLREYWHPLGPVGVVTAFNFPAAVWSWNALLGAVVGDSMVWKPSSQAPLTAIALTRLVNGVLQAQGAPPIFMLLVGGGRTVGERLLEDHRLPLISFTGSVATGRHVAQVVAGRLGRTILELGGNNGAIVTARADLELALKGVAFGALATAGQRCTSTRRVIVHAGVYTDFLARLGHVYRMARVGNPLEDGTLVGPLIDRPAVASFLDALERVQAEGGRVVCGGEPETVPGCEGGHYVRPTLVEVDPTCRVPLEETFAPILYCYRYQSLDEAFAIHNSVPQGLSSAIFTTDLREAERFLSAQGSDCGMANVNTSTAGAEIGGAFGGEKETGGGRESGSDAWKAYARRVTSTVNYGYELPLAQGVSFPV
ncbi:MAG: aldehyde dehydrogenase family protein [Thermoleophilia bacterium]|nr:aldehyde dehydrogenase family protein [Thermoleophilia bacterium]